MLKGNRLWLEYPNEKLYTLNKNIKKEHGLTRRCGKPVWTSQTKMYSSYLRQDSHTDWPALADSVLTLCNVTHARHSGTHMRNQVSSIKQLKIIEYELVKLCSASRIYIIQIKWINGGKLNNRDLMQIICSCVVWSLTPVLARIYKGDQLKFFLLSKLNY